LPSRKHLLLSRSFPTDISRLGLSGAIPVLSLPAGRGHTKSILAIRRALSEFHISQRYAAGASPAVRLTIAASGFVLLAGRHPRTSCLGSGRRNASFDEPWNARGASGGDARGPEASKTYSEHGDRPDGDDRVRYIQHGPGTRSRPHRPRPGLAISFLLPRPSARVSRCRTLDRLLPPPIAAWSGLFNC